MKEGELGTKSNPIKFFFTPSVDAKMITQNAKPLVDFLHKETGYYFETAVPQSYVAVVEAFGTNKADIAIMNTFSYLLAHEKFGAEARLRVVRVNNETTYRGQIITRFDSGIDSLKDLEGKKIAYVDAASTSGYILPKALLKKKGIQTAEESFGMKHDNVVTMVYQKQVDAGATFYSPRDPKTGIIQDARGRVVKQFPDVEQKIKIIALTEAIPNDPCMFRKGLPEKMKDKITKALIKFVDTPEGKEALDQIYSVRGLVPTKDSDYNVLRDLLSSLNFSIKNIVK
jgi:phosphonate transport system substrate-binding protein